MEQFAILHSIRMFECMRAYSSILKPSQVLDIMKKGKQQDKLNAKIKIWRTNHTTTLLFLIGVQGMLLQNTITIIFEHNLNGTKLMVWKK